MSTTHRRQLFIPNMSTALFTFALYDLVHDIEKAENPTPLSSTEVYVIAERFAHVQRDADECKRTIDWVRNGLADHDRRLSERADSK